MAAGGAVQCNEHQARLAAGKPGPFPATSQTRMHAAPGMKLEKCQAGSRFKPAAGDSRRKRATLSPTYRGLDRDRDAGVYVQRAVAGSKYGPLPPPIWQTEMLAFGGPRCQ